MGLARCLATLNDGAFRPALNAAQIDRDPGTGKLFVCSMTLRHTFGTLAVQAFPHSDVQAYMGQHADIATTMIYVHHRPQHAAADRLGQFVATDLATGGTVAAGTGEAPEAPAA